MLERPLPIQGVAALEPMAATLGDTLAVACTEPSRAGTATLEVAESHPAR